MATVASPDRVYRDALIEARHESVDALLAMKDAIERTLADDDPCFPGPEGRRIEAQRLRAIEEELARHQRLHRDGRLQRGVEDDDYRQWRDLAAELRQRVNVVEILDLAGHHLTRVGMNHRRGAEEWAGPCPVCGGRDRFRAWTGPEGRAWCRRCDWGGDAIRITQSFLPGCEQFRDACARLSAIALGRGWA